MKLITYARKVFLNEIDVFGSKLNPNIIGKTSGIQYQYGINKFMNELQRRASVVEFFEQTNLKGLQRHVDIEFKEYNDPDNEFLTPRWVIIFRRNSDGKLLDHIGQMGHAIEMITKSTSFECGSLVNSGVLESVAFIFHKE